MDAGSDASVSIGETLTLSGSATDDGLPGGALTTAWTQTGGPGAATFGDAAALDSTVSFDAAGDVRADADGGRR